MRDKVCFYLGVLLTGTLLSEGVLAADWNQWRGPDRTGYVSESPAMIDIMPDSGLQPVWKSPEIASARAGGWGSPVVADGVVYLFTHKKEQISEPPKKQFPWLSPDKRTGMSDEEYAEYEQKRRDEDQKIADSFEFREYVYAFDAQTGEEVWTNESESTYTRFPQSGCPTVVGDKLFILGAGRHARCLNARSGEEIWNTELPGEFRDEFYQASVLVVGETAIFNATRLFGLNINNGSVVWEGNPDKTQTSHSSPVAWQHNGADYVLSVVRGGKTVCLNPQTGEVLWQVESQGGNASPVVAGDKLLVYGNSRKEGLQCFRLTPDGADPLWVYQRVTDKGSTPIVTGKSVFVQGERKLACVDLETGEQLWMTNLDLENPQYSSPIAAGDVGFYAYGNLVAFKLSRENYTPILQGAINREYVLASEDYFRKQYRLDDTTLKAEARKEAMKKYQQEVGKQGTLKCTTPAVADGFLYLRLNDRLVCYDMKPPKN